LAKREAEPQKVEGRRTWGSLLPRGGKFSNSTGRKKKKTGIQTKGGGQNI